MKATLRQPSSPRPRAMLSGAAASASVSISRDLLMSQFWQNWQRQVAAGRAEGEHRRARQEVVERLLLDRVDAEAAGAAVGGEHDLAVVCAARTKQRPRWPSCSWQQRGQTSHWTRPSVEAVPVTGRYRSAVGIHTTGTSLAPGDIQLPMLSAASGKSRVRHPAVAGLFYPDQPQSLREAVRALLDAAPLAPAHDTRRPKAFIVPHAGFVYPGCVSPRCRFIDA